MNLLARATSLLPSGDPLRLELLCELGVAQRTGGDLGRAEQSLAEAVEEAVSARDRRLELRAKLELAAARIHSNPEGVGAELLQLAESALPVFEALGDDRSLGRALLLTGLVRGSFHLQNDEMEGATERALVHYRRAGWPTTTCVQSLATALFYGPKPVAEGVRRCTDLLARDVTDRAGEAYVRVWQAGLGALAGEYGDARHVVVESTRVLEELGQPVSAASTCATIAALTERLAGDLEAAESVLRASCELFATRGEWAHLATNAAELADTLYAQDRFGEADEWTRTSEQHAASDDLSAQFTWRSVRAKIVARAGDLGEAERLARHAVELVDRTDALNQRANVRLDLAHVLYLAKQPDAAAAVAYEAAHMYEQKGNIVSARVARSMIERLATV